MIKNNSYLNEHANVLNKTNFDILDNIYLVIKKIINSKYKILTCGNGGSAHTSEHMVTDWLKMTYIHTSHKLNISSLVSNIGMVSAYANDINFDYIFSEQLMVLGNKNDILFVISGSGNSENIIQAAKKAKELELKVISFVGFDGGRLKNLSDISFHVPSFDMQICEDIHLMAMHILMKKLCEIEMINQ